MRTQAKGDQMRAAILLAATGLMSAGLMETVSITAQDHLIPERTTDHADRPLVALWQRSNGQLPGGRTPPFLRFAIYADGRTVVAKDPSQWGHEFRRGNLSAARVARLKSAMVDSGILNLKGTCYLVPDAPVDCLLVDLGGEQRQLLYWDERESSSYGINIDPKPHHLEFQRVWKSINHLALVAVGDDGVEVKEQVQVPESWYIKPAVQSE